MTASGAAAPVPLRAARGVVVAAVGVLLATVAHGVAGGSASPGPLTLPVALLVLAGCVVASSRSWTPARLVAVLAGIQVVVHGAQLLGTSSAQVDPRLAGVATAATGHLHDHAAALTPGMLAAHAAAVALAALVLARVDVAVAVLWHLARRLLLPALAAALALPGLRPVTADPLIRPVRALQRSSGASRRGPPGLLRA